MKERNRRGKFRAAETVAYKMTQHHGFDQVSWQAFQEAAAEKYDFATCQRPDGSYYGTGGTCRKGADVPGGKPKDEKKGSAKSGGGGVTATPGNAAKTKAAMEKLKADKKAGGGVRQDRKEEAERKERNKAQKERDAKRQKNVEVNKKVEANNKKIEQLRKQHQKLPFGDKKKSAMMEEIDKLNKDTKSLLTRSTQGPQQRPQTGGAAGQRRAQAASNARD